MLASCLLLGSGSAAADWFSDAEAGVFHDNNVTRGQLSSDIRSDTAAYASFTVGQFQQFGDRTSISASLNLQNQTFTRFSGLSNNSLGLSVSSKTKFGLGPEAPWAGVSVSATSLDHHDDLRDGWFFSYGVSGGTALSERWKVRADYKREHRSMDQVTNTTLPAFVLTLAPGLRQLPGSVFDLHSHSLSLGAQFDYTDKIQFTFGYTRRTGDVESSTNPTIAILRVSTGLAPDPTFGPPFVAYKLDADTNIYDVGFSYATSQRSSLNFSAQRNMSYATGDTNYFSNVVRASFLYSF